MNTPFAFGRRAERMPWVWMLAIGAAALTVLAIQASSREYLGFGTETDFLSTFVDEAKQLGAGRPLDVAYHPPGYVIALWLVQELVPDWQTAGLLISWISALVVLLTVPWFFQRLEGQAAAIGALLAVATSPLFLRYGSMATTELLFMAQFSAALLAAIVAHQRGGTSRWLLTGVLVGVAALTRTNGFPLALLLVVPFLPGPAHAGRWRHAGAALTGMALPLAAWVALAYSTGSPLVPEGNHASLAMRYFAPDGGVAESWRAMDRQFDSLWAVVSHDPVTLLRVYLGDLWRLAQRAFLTSDLVSFPLGWLALPGLVLLAVPFRPFRTTYLLIVLAQIAIVNLRTYDPRFYLVLVPLLGASAGLAVDWAWRRAEGHRVGRLVPAAAAVALLIGFAQIVPEVRTRLHSSHAELSESVPAARGVLPEHAVIVSRKPHLAFYTGSGRYSFPDVETLDALRRALSAPDRLDDLYLYYGSQEARLRRQLSALIAPRTAPGWLTPVAQGADRGWVLYRVELALDASAGDSPVVVRMLPRERGVSEP